MQSDKFFSLEQVIDRQPLVVSPNTSLKEVISLMQEWGNSCRFTERKESSQTSTDIRSNNSCVLIVENSQLQGIFTERDLVRLIAAGNSTDNLTIEKVMSRDVITLSYTGVEEIFTALKLLKFHVIRHLPIVDNLGNLLGLITAKDIRKKLEPVNLMKWRQVKEVMDGNVVHAHPDDTVRSLAKLMAQHQTSCIAISETRFEPETDSSLIHPVGIITERDLVQFQNLDLDLEQPARNLMSTPLFLVGPEDTLWSVHQQMQHRRVRRFLVVGARKELVGIITQTSLLQIFDPAEMYGVINVLQQQVCELETERESLLQQRNSKLEQELQKGSAVIETQNKELEKNQVTLSKTTQELSYHVNNTPLAVVEWDRDFCVQRWSKQAEQIFGWQKSEVLGKNWSDWRFIVEEDIDRVKEITNRLLDGTEPRNVSYNRNYTKDGSAIDCEWYNSVLLDENGNLVSILSLVQDDSERQNALRDLQKTEVSLREREQKFRAIFDQTFQFIGLLEPNGTLIEANKTALDYIGLSPADVVGKFFWETPWWSASLENQTLLKQAIEQAAKGEFVRFEVEHPGTENRLVTVDFSLTPIKDETGQVIMLIPEGRNISELKQIEADLQKSNHILQAISSIQTQFLTDTKPEIIFDVMLDSLLELTQSEYGFIGEILITADGSPVMEESYMKFRGRPYLKTHAITNIAWNEETRAFYAENAPKGMEFHNLQTLFGAVIVTGEPVIANRPSDDPRREGLPDEHPPLNAFLGIPFYKNNKMTGMVGIANRQGGYDEAIIDYLRPFLDTCSRIVEAYKSDRQRQQAEEKNREQAALLDVATDAIMVRGLEHQLLFWNRGAEKLYGWSKEEALQADANEFLYRTSLAKLKEITKIAIAKGEWQGELNQVTKAGKEILVKSRWTLVKNEQGHPQSYLVVNTDITDQKQLEAQFLRTQRLESLGTLAGGIAHDLNNILAPILGFSKLLPLKLPNVDEQTKGFFKIMENNAQRGSALVKQILTFARGLEGDKGVVQIRHLIAEIGQIISETFPKSIELEINAPRTLWTVNADVNQLHQVLMNLAVNARDAMADGGKLGINAENFMVDEDYAKRHLDAAVGPHVLISVTDTGVGIPAEAIDRIFEPFFTTKAIGRGTGLGLSTVIGIIRSHDGFVDVISDRRGGKQGTQFKVFLPASETAENNLEDTEEILEGDGELVLVVDDETSILEVTKATLETYNYQVLTARNGIEAIATFAQNQQAIDLVIMDIMMPTMDGKTAIRTLKQINPEVKIIAVSGLITSQEIIAQLDGLVTAFMAKPYTNDDLLKMLQSVIKH